MLFEDPTIFSRFRYVEAVVGFCRGVLIAGVRSIQTLPYGLSMVFGGRDVVCALCCFPELSENVNGRGSLDGNTHIPSAVCVAFLFSRLVLGVCCFGVGRAS